jgi:hypothetical protein
MLNKIKDKILHVLRNYCGYYLLKGAFDVADEDYTKLNNEFIKLNDKNFELQTDVISVQIELDKLLAQHEAKILEYDILDNKYKKIVNVYTLCSTLNNHYDTEEIIKVGEKESSYLYKKYLVAELEEILNIMKEKGIHPQDLIKRIITKAKRDIK